MSEDVEFLKSLLGKTLHITIPDGRLFTGTFRCTDCESNIILANSHEYRMPSKGVIKQALESGNGVGKADMISRFVGLIVVPGNKIVSIQVEEKRTESSEKGS